LLVLQNERLDLAVALGAAHYGMVRRGAGARISGGLARSYYVGVAVAAIGDRGYNDAALPLPVAGVGDPGYNLAALCLAPAGLEEGQAVELAQTFDLLVRQP